MQSDDRFPIMHQTFSDQHVAHVQFSSTSDFEWPNNACYAYLQSHLLNVALSVSKTFTTNMLSSVIFIFKNWTHWIISLPYKILDVIVCDTDEMYVFAKWYVSKCGLFYFHELIVECLRENYLLLQVKYLQPYCYLSQNIIFPLLLIL